jgi:pteridine reductase
MNDAPLPRPVALVTGSVRRLGEAIADRFAQAGYDTPIHHRASPDEAAETARRIGDATGADCRVYAADLADPSACGDLIADVAADYGRIDVLVNSASIFAPTDIAAVTAAVMERFHAIHVVAPTLLTLAARRHMGKDGRIGHVINIIDMFADFAKPGFTPYIASKGGLKGVTRQLAYELASENILVNGVSPGAILEPPAGTPDDEKRRILAKIPMGRYGRPDDIADAVFFLATARYITGQVIVVDGGRSLRV